jgi:hypothetical protein
MLNTPTRSNAQQYLLANRAAEIEEKLPITDEARNGLSSLRLGLIGSLFVAVVIIGLKLAFNI